MVKIDPNKGKLEASYSDQGQIVAGIDEVGRGCLAGPVVTAAAVLDYQALFALDEKHLELIRDSKTLSHNQRVKIIPLLEDICISKAIGKATPREIEKLGILKATFLAMHRALASLDVDIDLLLVDGNQALPDYTHPQKTVIKGDNLCYCIAAASIIAKEERDSYMNKQAIKFPDYGFESHVGYGTKKHMDALSQVGICTLHRRNFAPVQRAMDHHP